jgi:hypothetical protein
MSLLVVDIYVIFHHFPCNRLRRLWFFSKTYKTTHTIVIFHNKGVCENDCCTDGADVTVLMLWRWFYGTLWHHDVEAMAQRLWRCFLVLSHQVLKKKVRSHANKGAIN